LDRNIRQLHSDAQREGLKVAKRTLQKSPWFFENVQSIDSASPRHADKGKKSGTAPGKKN